MAAIKGGHTNFMVNQMRIANVIACPNKVALIFTILPFG